MKTQSVKGGVTMMKSSVEGCVKMTKQSVEEGVKMTRPSVEGVNMTIPFHEGCVKKMAQSDESW